MRAIASLDMAHFDELKSTHEKLLVLRGLTKILATAEAQFADNIAFMLAKAEENQLQFIALLSAPRPGSLLPDFISLEKMKKILQKEEKVLHQTAKAVRVADIKKPKIKKQT